MPIEQQQLLCSYLVGKHIEEEEGCYMLRPVDKTDHMCQDIKILAKH